MYLHVLCSNIRIIYTLVIHASGTVLSNRVNGEEAAFKKTKQGCLENMQAMSAGNIGHLDMVSRNGAFFIVVICLS